MFGLTRFPRICLIIAVVAPALAGCGGSPAQPQTVQAGNAPATPSASPVPDLASTVDTFLKTMVKQDRFSGAVLIAKDGVPRFKGAYGLANRSFNVPNQVDTKFNLASMNKMFTAVAIAQLAEQGKLAFTDPIRKHLPEYPNKAVADKVTIHHLLTHTSGMGDYMDKPEFLDGAKDHFRTVNAFLQLFVDDPLAFEPGERPRYSNAGYIVLGAIIERVSGQSYFDYVREHIYQPAGMTDTGAYELDQDVPNLAIGYTRAGQNNLFMHVVKGNPAGGGFSTVEDLLKFAIALRSHKLLSPASTDLLLAGKVDIGPDRPNARYAYGFVDSRRDGVRIVGHSGAFAGISTRFSMYMDLGYTVVVLANCDPPIANTIADGIFEIITHQKRADGDLRAASCSWAPLRAGHYLV